jgi:Mrp family chromosome partitioning ATPase
MDHTLAARFHLLRARVESEVERPGIVMLTSAQSGDGAAFAAHGLAESLAAVGHRTVVLDGDALPSGEAGASSSRDALRAFVERMRGRFDFTIIGAEPVLSSSTGMLLAGEVDAIVLTVRLGRAPANDDALVMRALSGVRAMVLGSVGASAAAIAEFERTRQHEATAQSDTRLVPASLSLSFKRS